VCKAIIQFLNTAARRRVFEGKPRTVAGQIELLDTISEPAHHRSNQIIRDAGDHRLCALGLG